VQAWPVPAAASRRTLPVARVWQAGPGHGQLLVDEDETSSSPTKVSVAAAPRYSNQYRVQAT